MTQRYSVNEEKVGKKNWKKERKIRTLMKCKTFHFNFCFNMVVVFEDDNFCSSQSLSQNNF